MLKLGKKSKLIPLQKGDLVDVISPSSPVSQAEYKKIVDFLEKNGLKARFFLENELIVAKKANNLFSSDEKLRFKQLKMALSAKDSKAIWCVRGGYGSSDLIEFLAKEKKIKQKKLFIGFSDLTSLGGFLASHWNYKIIYGSMLTQLSQEKVTKKSEKKLFDLVFGNRNDAKNFVQNVVQNVVQQSVQFKEGNLGTISYELNALNKIARNSKKIEGKLVGGCCSVVLQTLGTINEINFKDKILLLEDIDENGERLDRFFQQFLQIFVNKKQIPKAILLGNFYQFVKEENKKKRIKKAIENLVKNIDERGLKISVFEDKNKSIGHSENNMAVIIGENAVIFDRKFIQIV